MTSNPKEYYEKTRREAEFEIARASRKAKMVSWLRLAVAVVAIVATWWLWGDTQAIILLLAGCVVLFLVLVKLHNRLYASLAMWQAVKQVAIDNLSRISLDLSGLDGGCEYINPRHNFSYDLDLFGDKSLFALIDTTSTRGGRDLLAANLQDPDRVAAQIERRQEAIKELATMPDFMTQLQALGALSRVASVKTSDVPLPSMKIHWWQRVATILFPLLILVPVVFAIAGKDVSIYIETVAVVSLLTAIAGAKQVGQLHVGVDRIVGRISIYYKLLHEIEQRHFSAPLLCELQRRLSSDDEPASMITRKLSRLLSNLDQRYNWLSYTLLNILLQWDYRQAINVMSWMKRYSAKLTDWEETLSSIDELCALATFSFGNPEYVFPCIDRTSDVVIEARQVGHPLIDADRCVRNDIDMLSAGKFMVVTGANMAGKSTYLRTVGVNYLLALVGAPVCASSMTIGVATLFTGLRTTDSLSDGESYFFAELRRLQSIVTRAAAGERMLIILDEILKGTNSADKQKGSLALVSKLVGMNVAGIIATHDLMVGSLADRFPGKVFNCCFEATIDGETLRFDYMLRHGIAQNLNAYFLMQHMGIV